MGYSLMQIYDYRNRIGKQKELLSKESPENVELVERFVRDQRVKSEISPSREYILYNQMRFIARTMKDKLSDPCEDDIKDLVEKINSYKAQKGKKKDGTYRTEVEASDVTKRNIKNTVRQFYRWLNDDTPPKFLKLVKVNKKLSREREKEIISPELHKRMIDACENHRDKAIISLLYDSGARAGEILNRAIKDIEFTDYGMVLRIRSGKTSYRKVVIVGDSPVYLRSWLDVHPDRNNLNAPLFVKVYRRGESGGLTYNDLSQVFQRLKERAGIQERIHPHLYRHTRASILAGSVAEAPLESQMGWVHGSKMTQTYVHLSAQAQEMAVLKAYGLKKEETVIQTHKAIKCPRCEKDNLSDAKYCRFCWLPLTVDEALKQQEKEQKVTTALSDLISPEQKVLLQNLPEESKLDVLTTLLLDFEKSGKLELIKERVKPKG